MVRPAWLGSVRAWEARVGADRGEVLVGLRVLAEALVGVDGGQEMLERCFGLACPRVEAREVVGGGPGGIAPGETALVVFRGVGAGWRTDVSVQDGIGGKARMILILVLSVLTILLGLLIFVPYPLKMDAKGTVTACWLSGKLYANVSHDGGKTFGPKVEINPAYDPCNCCTTSAAFGADGKLAVLYREETNNE